MDAVEAGDARAFVPEALPNTEAPGAEGGLTLVAFTLVRRDEGLDLYAAARNDGPTPICEPGMTTDFVDGDERLVGSAGTELYSGRYFRLEDGSGAILSCVPPGELAMGASLALPEAIVLEELAFLRHSFPAFIVPELVPVNALTLRDVEAVRTGAGTEYSGTFVNELELGVTNPRVVVFPLNRVGRPLGVASSQATLAVPPGGSFGFVTSTVGDSGAGHAAFPGASIVY